MRIEKVFAMPFANLYPLYLKKVASKGRSREELDAVIGWLTGYGTSEIEQQVGSGNDLEAFFATAPRQDLDALAIKGVVCGVRVEQVEDPLMRRIRYMDKVVDELAKGKAVDKIVGR
ncbi:MAG: DUF2200 domain-containing protein [Lysobacteraceae bacterium]|nr:MAG: DUF2200 domain-containing protein [Xanthomonadaceae bacterium]